MPGPITSTHFPVHRPRAVRLALETQAPSRKCKTWRRCYTEVLRNKGEEATGGERGKEFQLAPKLFRYRELALAGAAKYQQKYHLWWRVIRIRHSMPF